MRKIQIGDLDGCISDDRWRRGLIRPEITARVAGWGDKFDAYHAQCWRDEARNLHHLQEDCELVILTGRPLKVREVTMAWLEEVACVRALHILFRNNDDFRPSVEVKRTQLGWLLEHYGVRRTDIVMAMDDMAAIVTMYHEQGIPSRIVRIGDEEHHHG